MGGADKIEPNPAGEVQLLGFAAGLNEAGTEAEYLSAIAAMCGLDLDQSSVLAADWSSMAMLHGSVKTILRNATRTPEAVSAIAKVFPQKFLIRKPEKVDRGEKRKHSESDQVNVMEAVNKRFHALENSLRAGNSAATAAARAPSRSRTATRPPSLAKRRATAAAKPEPPPVVSSTLPSNRIVIVISL